jgi:hypothetical protein
MRARERKRAAAGLCSSNVRTRAARDCALASESERLPCRPRGQKIDPGCRWTKFIGIRDQPEGDVAGNSGICSGSSIWKGPTMGLMRGARRRADFFARFFFGFFAFFDFFCGAFFMVDGP